MNKTRACKICKREKSISDFYKCRGYREGYMPTCKVCMRIHNKELMDTNPELKEKRAKYKKEWAKQNPDRVNKSHKKCRDSEKGREWYKKYQEEHKEYYRGVKKKYAHSPKGKITNDRGLAKRQRNLGYFRLFNNPFPDDIEVDYHHINNLLVIPLPRITHKNTLGKSHRKKCNEILLKYYSLDLETLLQE